MSALIDKCEWCGADSREVHHSDQHGAWLCVGCFLSSPGGAVVQGEPRRLPSLRDLHPSRVFEPLPWHRRHSDRDALRAAMRGLDDADRREVENWIRGDEVYDTGGGGHGLVTGGVLDLSPSVYVPALSGREVRFGRIECPFHGDGEQHSPSLQVYEEGWYCHGCGKGGTVVNFAAELWGIEPRGRGFHEIRERLEDEFGMRAA